MAAAEGADNAAPQRYQWTSDDSGDSGDSLFFGPFSGKSLKQRRQRRNADAARGAARGEGQWWARRRSEKRKIETQPREGRFEYDFDEGDLRRWRLDSDASPWWTLIRHPQVYDESSRAAAKFRAKFRLPRKKVDMLMTQAVAEHPEWADKTLGQGCGRGASRCPLILKVLAVMRHLGKGLDPEAIEDGAHISASTIKSFIPPFLKWLSTTFYAAWVKLPEGAHLQRSLRVYEELGFPGAFCSADGVHVAWDRSPSKNNHLFVGKEGYATVAFVVCVLHSREIIHVDDAVPGAINDKTQARTAVLFNQLRQGAICPEHVYYLYDKHGRRVAWKGIYAIVDNGFHQWRVLQAPLKHATSFEAAGWSKRLESTRKDSECTFGTMKKRFRVLRLPFMCWHMSRINDTFRACAALHNMLLHHDGYHTIGHRRGDYVNGRAEAQRRDLDVGRMDRTIVRAPDALQPGAPPTPTHTRTHTNTHTPTRVTHACNSVHNFRRM